MVAGTQSRKLQHIIEALEFCVGTAHWLLMSLSAYAALTRARSHTPSGAGIATSGSSSVMSIPYGRKFGEIAHTGEDEYERHEQEKKLKEYVGKISLGSSKYSV